MPGITDPGEEYFKDGLWGWVTSAWKKLIADAAGHLQVDVVASDLPAGGATAAHQVTMITALQLIDDLRSALNSIAADELDVVFDGQNLDVEVTQTTPADLTPGIEGWDGTQWRKLGLLWGYTDRWLEQVFNPNAAVGWNFLETAPVPAGYVYVAVACAANNQNTNPSAIQLGINIAGSRYYLKRVPTPGVDVWVDWTATQIFKAGDKALAAIGGCALNDDLVFNVWGYKMAVG